MAFHYDKKQKSDGNDSFWTSYSDLFLGLSSIFLLLYVTASLRTGTGAMASQQENQKLSMKVEELQNQLKVYESVKNDYMQNAEKGEQQEYQELMDKLVLLQEEAKSERDKLNMQAKDNAQKATALNKYQQMIRNIMNANKVAKTKIASRDDIIVDKNTEIIKLESDVETKKQQIEESEAKIEATEAALKTKMQDLKKALQSNKITKAVFEKQSKAARDANERRLSQLRAAAAQQQEQLVATNAKLNELNQSLNETQGQLATTQGELQKTGQELARKGEEVRGLSDKLAATAGEASSLKKAIGDLKGSFAAEKARERGEFEAQLAKEKLTGAQRAGREAAFRDAAERKAAAMGNKLAGLEGQLKSTEGELAKAKEEIDARKAIAGEIKKSFAAAGVDADIDMGTGEVVLDFGNTYFDSGSARLKPQMTAVLEKAMPAYSKSLFGNPKLAGKISTVEIVGFASPTFQGRFIDPNSTKPEDRKALKYNMDLSYQRANSIFQHMIDGKGKGEHEKDLLPLMKVSGRSFLEVMEIQDRNVANAAEFCKVNDCKKAQRVIIRFSMDGKKK
ncbi:MAG: microtubule-binding protein [Bdellovibrionota bacterium]